MRKYIHLFGIVIVVWLMMMLGFFILSQIFNALLLLEGYVGKITINIILIIAGTTMAFIWLFTWRKLAVLYFESCLKNGTKF